jgi:protein-S-isoprenylcysteine O-methyltransferase Ste14
VSLTAPQIVFIAGFVVYFAIRGIYARHRRTRMMLDVRIDWIEKALLAAVSAAMLVLPPVYLLSSILDFADFTPPAWLVWPGAAAMAAAGALLWKSHADLGRNWSPSLEIGADQTLITDGVYRHIRHPMYVSFMLYSVGQALLLHNWIAGPATFLTFLMLYFTRLSREEQMMLDCFDEQYRAYMKRTGRLMPRLFRRG